MRETGDWRNNGRALRVLIEGAVDRLPDDVRAVFVLREVQRLTTAEVADVLDLSPAAVRTRRSWARLAVRQEVARLAAPVARGLFRFYRPRCDRVVAGVLARLANAAVSRTGAKCMS